MRLSVFFKAGLLFCSLILASGNALAAQRYDLESAVARALDKNFRVSAAQSGLEAAEEGRKAARANFGPVLSTSYAYDKLQSREATVLARQQDDELYTWSNALKQNIFSGFSTLSSYQKAALQKDSAAAGLSKARLDLILLVQRNFFDYIKARENVRSAEDSLTRLQAQLKVINAFYKVGFRPRLDVLQAEVDVSEAESLLLQAQNTVSTQKTRLNTLLIIGAGGEAEYVGDLDFIPFYSGLEECLAAAYGNRPDIMIARKSIEIAGQDISMAASNFYPKIDATARWSTKGDDPTASGSSVTPDDFSSWSVGVIGQMDLFSWGNTYYSVSQAKQLQNKTVAEEANLRQEVVYEVQSRLLKLDESVKRIKVSRKGLEQAKEAYRMAAARYEAQVGTATDVLDAQAKLTAAEVSLTSAQADYLIALASLYAAMGEENPSLTGR